MNKRVKKKWLIEHRKERAEHAMQKLIDAVMNDSPEVPQLHTYVSNRDKKLKEIK